MNATGWVAVAGIVGTLVGALLGPVVGERARRNSSRAEALMTRRLDTYAGLLRLTADYTDKREMPRDFSRTAERQAELERMLSQVRVVGSRAVYEHTESMMGDIRKLLSTEVDMDDEQSKLELMLQLVELGGKHMELERIIRSDVGTV